MKAIRTLLATGLLAVTTLGATGCAGIYADSNGTTCVIIVALPICN